MGRNYEFYSQTKWGVIKLKISLEREVCHVGVQMQCHEKR